MNILYELILTPAQKVKDKVFSLDFFNWYRLYMFYYIIFFVWVLNGMRHFYTILWYMTEDFRWNDYLTRGGGMLWFLFQGEGDGGYKAMIVA